MWWAVIMLACLIVNQTDTLKSAAVKDGCRVDPRRTHLAPDLCEQDLRTPLLPTNLPPFLFPPDDLLLLFLPRTL